MWYLAASAANSAMGRRMSCPSCGASRGTAVSRKYLVTALRRCGECRLLYRTPTTSEEAYERYYEDRYHSGLTTELPSDEELASYLRESFAGSPKCFRRSIDILDALGIGSGARLLDYGCSWGYGAWQFTRRGHAVTGFEPSVARATFGRAKLGLDIVSDRNDIRGHFDAVFSAHVVEHVPTISELLAFALSKLKPGGILVAVTPNGSLNHRQRRPERWRRIWGFKHPILLDEEYLTRELVSYPCLITTRLRDFQGLARWSKGPRTIVGDTAGWELLVAVRNTPRTRDRA